MQVGYGLQQFKGLRSRLKIRPLYRNLGFLMGLGGQLYLSIPPLGTIPMLDIVAYLTCIPLLVMLLPRLGNTARCSLLMGIGWSIAAVFANAVNGYEGMFVLKMFAVCSSSWTIFLVAWYLLEKDARVYLYYLIGAGIGAAIGIHYFQNGAYLAYVVKTGKRATEALIDKQIYPAYAKALFYLFFGILLYAKKAPPVIVAVIGVFSGFYLLFNGGSRSSFGFYVVASAVGYFVSKFPGLSKRFFKHSVLWLPIAVIGCMVIFGLYSHLAKNGSLGENELEKYLQEEEYSAESSESRMSTRSGIWETWEVVKSKPWGEGGNLARHSVISNSWNCEGYMGLMFWLYFYWLVFWYFKNKIAMTGWYSSFIVLEILIACWAVAGSPFGARHHFFVLMALVALSKDKKYYGEGLLYNAVEVVK